MKKSLVRSQRGVSGLVIVLASAFMILLPLGFLGYEFMRWTTVQQELRSDCEAAALAGAVGIATNGGSAFNGVWQQDYNAMYGAYLSFCQNSVSGCQFNSVDAPNTNTTAVWNSTATPPYNTPPQPFSAIVNFVLLSNNGSNTGWTSTPSSSVPAAASIRVDAYYGYELPLLGGLGIGPFTMVASATGALPALDLVLCFDMSGSMDDFTCVTVVDRKWVSYSPSLGWSDPSLNGSTASSQLLASLPANWSGGCIEYVVPASSGSYSAYPFTSGNPQYWTESSDGSASGPLYYISGCANSSNNYNGTGVNVQPPMNLNEAILWPSGYQMYFDASLRNSSGWNSITTAPSPGTPPGNYVAYPGTANTPVNFGIPSYTDLVVNLPNPGGANFPYADAHWNPTSSPYTANLGGLIYKDIAWALEASRGNLESNTALAAAVDPDAASNPSADNGYNYFINYNGNITTNSFASIKSAGQNGSFAAYWNEVQTTLALPLSVAVSQTQLFFNTMYASANCHFGMVCFSDGIGESPTDSWADGWESPPGGSQINGWTTAAVNGASGNPPPSAAIGGTFTGGSSMGTLSPADTNGGNLTVGLPLLELNGGASATGATPSNYDNYATFPATQSGGVTNYMTSSTISATGSTDIYDALAEAIRELNPSTSPCMTRPQANRAIVLFTDGIPDIDPQHTPPCNASSVFSSLCSDINSNSCAAQCAPSNLNISLFAIGLCMDTNSSSTMYSNQGTCLSQMVQAANGGAASGNSQWQQVQNVNDLESTFQTTVKQLVVLTH